MRRRERHACAESRPLEILALFYHLGGPPGDFSIVLSLGPGLGHTEAAEAAEAAEEAWGPQRLQTFTFTFAIASRCKSFM